MQVSISEMTSIDCCIVTYIPVCSPFSPNVLGIESHILYMLWFNLFVFLKFTTQLVLGYGNPSDTKEIKNEKTIYTITHTVKILIWGCKKKQKELNPDFILQDTENRGYPEARWVLF